MLKRTWQVSLLAIALVFTACNDDRFEDLQKQIDDLNEKVEAVEADQQAAMEAALAALEANLAAMEEEMAAEIAALEAAASGHGEQYDSLVNSFADLVEDYEAMIAELEAIQSDVEANASSVYYGNLISDTEYADYVASGAHIVTGRVIISSQQNADDLVDLQTIGGSLTIEGGSIVELPALATVAGDILIEGLDVANSTVNLPALTIAGEDFEISTNPGLVSVKTETLGFIAGDLVVENMSGSYGDYISELAELELGGSNVLKDVIVSGVNGGDLELGIIGGSLTLYKNIIRNLVIGTATLENLSIERTAGDFEVIEFNNLTTITNALNISKNKWDKDGSGSESGITTLSGVFSALTGVGTEFTIVDNDMMLTLDDFNNVLSIGGNLGTYDQAYVTVDASAELINVLNGLETVGGYYQIITLAVKSDFVTAFQALTTPEAKKMDIITNIGVYAEFSEGGGGIGIGSTKGTRELGSKETVYRAFDKVTSVRDLIVDMTGVCETESYGNSTGGKATITAFTALTEVGDELILDFSAPESEINFTGLNALTTIYKYSFADKFIMRFNVNAESLTVNLDAFENLADIKIMVIEHVTKKTDTGSTTINMLKGWPTMAASGSKFKYECMNVYLSTWNPDYDQFPRAVCSGDLSTLLTSAFVDGTLSADNELWNSYESTELVNDTAVDDDIYDQHYNAIFNCI